MGTVIRFPQERVDHYKHAGSGGAMILVLPVVRVERWFDPCFNACVQIAEEAALVSTETFASVSASFQELYDALLTTIPT